MSINQRVADLNKYSKKYRNIALSSTLDISRSAFSSIVNGNTSPSYDTIVQILEQFPNLRTDWFIKGEGEMWDNSEMNSQIAGESEQVYGKRNDVDVLLRAIDALTSTNKLLREEISRLKFLVTEDKG